MVFRRNLKACIYGVLLLANASEVLAENDACASGQENQCLRAIYETEWAWRAQQFPDLETGDPLAPVPARLAKVDNDAQSERRQYWENVLKQLDGIHFANLSPAERVNYGVYRPQIERLAASQRFRDYEMPVNSDSAFWSELSGAARRPFRIVQDYHNWIAQMRDIPRYFREQTEQMKAGLKRGFTAPRVTLEGREAAIAVVVDGEPDKSAFYAPFLEMPGVPEKEKGALRAEALIVIHEKVQPAYAELLKFVRDVYIPGARKTLAAADLPRGLAWYQEQILNYTTLDQSPNEIHRFGLAEVARLHAEMVAAMKETGFAGDFAAFQEFLRTDPRFYAKTPDELLMHAAWTAKQFDGKAATYFGYLPRGRFTIRPVPDDIAPYYTAGRGGAGVYLLNTYKLDTRPLYNLPALTLHESAPGHSLQTAIALEHADQPAFRQHTYISAFGEGWALYCELLGQEMGLYRTPYERFGMLGYQIWRAARLVVDTGIHTKGWSRDKAIAYFREYTALPEQEITTEIDRYISWPAQALSYYLGETAILKARAKAEKALGDRFNIRAFHDAVLELGSVPLPVLDERIDRFIAEGGKGPYPEME